MQKNGAVITWGEKDDGGSISAVSASLNGVVDVTKIFSTSFAFAALRSDGSLVTWGSNDKGGDSSSVATELDGDSNGDGNASDTSQDITKVFSTTMAFAALRADNKVVTWGYEAYGGDSSSVRSILNGTLDDDSISKSASVSAGGNLVLDGDHVGDRQLVHQLVIHSLGHHNPVHVPQHHVPVHERVELDDIEVDQVHHRDLARLVHPHELNDVEHVHHLLVPVQRQELRLPAERAPVHLLESSNTPIVQSDPPIYLQSSNTLS